MKLATIVYSLIIIFISCQTEKKQHDSALSPGETLITVKWDTIKTTMHYCSAKLENGKVKFSIIERKGSRSDIAIDGSQEGKYLLINVYQAWALGDKNYRPKRFQILEHSAKLDKVNYKKGENLHGRLNLLLLGHKDYLKNEEEINLREDWDTVRIYGDFHARVQ